MASRGLFAAALLAVFVAFAAAEFATLGPFSFSDEQVNSTSLCPLTEQFG